MIPIDKNQFLTTVSVLRRRLPSFCWQSAYQILTMLEQEHEWVSEDCISSMLSQMIKTGEVLAETRRNRQGCSCLSPSYRKFFFVYRRNENYRENLEVAA